MGSFYQVEQLFFCAIFMPATLLSDHFVILSSCILSFSDRHPCGELGALLDKKIFNEHDREFKLGSLRLFVRFMGPISLFQYL